LARPPRSDHSDTWHHVMNRGIARRTLFEHGQDMEVFQEQLGAAGERGEVEVHAYCMLSTHFHLLVRSPQGELGRAMQRVQTEYSRWFNRGRRRDGSLVRGRYLSKPVESIHYRHAVVDYIDRNAVAAGLVPRACDYPHGSARFYAREARGGPPWLERSWVEETVRETLGLSSYDPARYSEVFGKLPEDLARVVEARWGSRVFDDPLDDLVAAAPAGVKSWMERKARLADRVPPGCPIVGLSTLEDAIRAIACSEDGGEGGRRAWKVGARDGWPVVRAGLTRELCGADFRRIAAHLGVSVTTASKLARLHGELVLRDEDYARRAALAAARALDVWRYGV